MTTTCPNCQGVGKLYLQAEDLNHKISSQSFNYYRCISCRLIFIAPIPANLSEYYKTEYPPYSIPKNIEGLERAADDVSWRVELVGSHIKQGRLLEIGPSYGAFLYAATRAGYDVDAIELDQECCDYIKKSIPQATVINTSDVVHGIKELNKKYDIIVMWHNLEHLPDPWLVMEQCISILEPNGIIIISTPNPDSLQFRIFRTKWVHLDAPRHLSLIPQKTLFAFMSQRGLSLAFLTTKDPDGLRLNNMGWGWSLSYLFSVPLENPVKRVISGVIRLLLSPVERSTAYGAAYTAVFRNGQ